jgi:hypothetical protein
MPLIEKGHESHLDSFTYYVYILRNLRSNVIKKIVAHL